MRLSIPEFSLVVLIGASGSGKSSFAARHFLPTEVICSDACRGLVSDNPNDHSVSADAFEVLRYIAGKRLARRRLTVIDATSVRAEDRRDLIHLAREYHALPVAIVVDMPESLCQERNRARADRDFGRHVVRNHIQALRRSLRGLKREGFAQWHVLTSPEEVDAVEIERTRLWTDRRDLQGPFDIIGDVHGCFDELQRLLARLGYEITRVDGTYSVRHPEERIVVFVGDLVDRGPAVAEVLRLAMDMVDAGVALCVQGNHEVKLARKLAGREVQIKHGLDKTLAALDGQDEAFRVRVQGFVRMLLSHYWLDDGQLVVAHAGLLESMHGRGSPAVRAFALYGETAGEVDEFGLPVRHNWAAHYRGRARVVFGHTPTPEAEWLNNTICIDTGCVFGGKLTALRYPELQLVSEPAVQVYDEPIRPLPVAGSPGLSAQHAHDDLLDLEDVLGRRRIETELAGAITIREENAAAALEIMARFAIDPRWLIYLPPTMSPSETSSQPDLLEHPAEAFAYYRRRAIPRVICQQKHMGSRAVVVVCRDEASARRRFGALDGETGAIYTRTGRAFFSSDRSLEAAVLARLRDILGTAGAWQRFETNWFCLDCELLPWSAKAGALLRQQYAPVAASARLGLSAALDALARAHARGIEVAELLQRTNERAETIEAYAAAYRRYCWPVESVLDLKLAPFHILATEGSAHVDKSHSWHMEEIARLSEAGERWLQPTEHCVVELEDATSVAAAVDWWTALTAQGEEGMVVKPEAFISHGRRGLTQPALKVRGHEYLRIIYGPEYTLPDHLAQLRARGLSRKRSLALQEFALGVEALRRFVSRAPLRKVHECVFGVLALESEPVDPRL